MKKLKLMTVIWIVVLIMSLISGCMSPMKPQVPACPPIIDSPNNDYQNNYNQNNNNQENNNQNEYKEIVENNFTFTSEKSKSIFSMDVNTASYANLRSYVNDYKAIDPNMVRIEEMINYFQYDYEAPTGDDPLKVNGAMFDCPWNSQSKLLRVGVKAKDIEFEETSNNLVFLLDVSGSMDSPDKLGYMQQAFSMLVKNLNEGDTVSIVTYASSDKVLLDGGMAGEQTRILNIINELKAGGSTAGANGIQTAYELARKHFIEGGNNRVILATDGDFNVGISSIGALEDFIAEKRETGVYLSVLGFGYGNLKDNKMETLALKGNGNYTFIDSVNQARKVLVDEIGGTLVTVAKDVKAQVEFNPAKVLKYRLIGYENKMLNDEEWEDNTADAGEIGAGHVVTAIYEVYLANTDEETTMEDNFAKVSLRYRDPDATAESEVSEINTYLSDDDYEVIMSEDSKFISAVVEIGLLLRNSQFKGTANTESVIQRLQGLDCVEEDSYKAEFLALVIKGHEYYE